MYELVSKYKDRFLTAILLVAIVGAIFIINNKMVIWSVLGLIFLLSFHESLKLFDIKNDYLYVGATLIWLVAYFLNKPHEIILLLSVGAISYLAYTKELNQKLLYPFLYPSFSILMVYSLYLHHGVISLVWLVVTVAFTDICAFFVGKKFGKTPFSPSSPNKTLEGVIGGVIFGTLFGTIIGSIYVGVISSVVITLFVSIFSVFGDLFESYLKREAEVKDSGNILPGHGGVLDRVDGYLFGVVFLYILLEIR
ncbi:MAG: phosphatidate cytidylyltransferase [Campylobacterales bacterium]|nr:phosphatidate cytidylyltransferase [Campylobacterales bacterium]